MSSPVPSTTRDRLQWPVDEIITDPWRFLGIPRNASELAILRARRDLTRDATIAPHKWKALLHEGGSPSDPGPLIRQTACLSRIDLARDLAINWTRYQAALRASPVHDPGDRAGGGEDLARCSCSKGGKGKGARADRRASASGNNNNNNNKNNKLEPVTVPQPAGAATAHDHNDDDDDDDGRKRGKEYVHFELSKDVL